MKKWFFILSLVTVLMLPVVAAATITVNDVTSNPPYTQAEVWRTGQVVNGSYAGTGIFQDYIGRQFATDSITFNFNPFSFTILTNNQPGGFVINGKNWGIADLAINFNSNTASYDGYTLIHFPGAVSLFELGVNMQAYGTGTPGRSGSGTAILEQVSVWSTSFAQSNPVAGINYGGAYKSSAAAAGTEVAPVEVKILEGSRITDGTIEWVVNDPTLNINNNDPNYKITVTFPNIVGAQAEFLWGTALCGNDIVHVSAAPIPGSLLLLGSGVMGLLGIGLRKRNQA
jgi:hypothetical protein